MDRAHGAFSQARLRFRDGSLFDHVHPRSQEKSSFLGPRSGHLIWDSLILHCGASAIYPGAAFHGEVMGRGRGVAAAPTCTCFFYKEQDGRPWSARVNTAVEEALSLGQHRQA